MTCKADGDVWVSVTFNAGIIESMELSSKLQGITPIVEKYYQYLMIHVENLMVASCHDNYFMEDIGKIYTHKKTRKTSSDMDHLAPT